MIKLDGVREKGSSLKSYFFNKRKNTLKWYPIQKYSGLMLNIIILSYNYCNLNLVQKQFLILYMDLCPLTLKF